jgi:hypothetical protein
MRTVINSQMMFGQIDISAIVFDTKSRDDIPKLLRGLQELYINIELRQRVFAILEEVRPARKNGTGKADMNNGRPGMEQWTILVLGALRLGLNIDYDRLLELVNQHKNIRQMIGLDGWNDKTTYELQTIKDNVQLFTPELLDRINLEVVRAGHTLVKKNQTKELPLMARGDSFVVETNIHFPADTSQLFDAIRKVIELTAKLSIQQGSMEWRQYRHVIRSIKRELRVVQKLNHSTSKNAEKKEKAVEEIKKAYQNYVGSVEYQLVRAMKTVDELGADNPLLSSIIYSYMSHAEIQIDQIHRRIFMNEKIPHEEKVFSIFEPHTEWISKGKKKTPVEFGLKVCIVQDQFQFILHHQVMEHITDSEIAVSIVKETKSRFSNLRSISLDKGFHSPKNQIELRELVDIAVVPKKGKLSESDKARESDPEFKRLRKQHSAVESGINALEVHGLDRCLDHGIDGFKRYVALGVLAYNIHRFGALLMKQDLKRQMREQKRAA